MTGDPRAISFPWFDSTLLIDQAFERLIHAPWGRSGEDWAPAVDVVETDDAYLIAVEIPGVPPEAVQVRVEGSTLTVSGERQSVRVTQSGRAVQVERSQGKFCRVIPLHSPVDSGRLEVRSELGVLYARLPKSASKMERSR